MKVLVACEESQAVCIAFRERGHEAYSCDIQDCSGGHPEWHIKDNVLKHLENWDLVIAFPPCTHLSSAGAPSWKKKQENGLQNYAIQFVWEIYEANCSAICVENPVGILNTIWRKPDQIIHPYMFGDPYMKRTCLWYRGLPALKSTNIVKPEFHYTSNSTRGGLLKDGTRRKSKLPIRKAWDNSFERSKTFPGIAKAMAEQWG